MAFGLAFAETFFRVKTFSKVMLACFFFLASSCNYSSEQKNAKGNHSTQSANHHMHKRPFIELIKNFEDPERELWQKPQKLIESLGNLSGKTIADIGAGTGYFSFRLAEAGASVWALDVDDRFLKYIKNKKVELNDSLVLPKKIPYDDPLLDSSSVDIVLIVDTYHHIEEREKYFKKVLKGLKAGGKLMVVDFKKEETTHGPPLEMRISGLKVLKELQQAGFSKAIIDVNTLPQQYIVTAKKAIPRQKL